MCEVTTQWRNQRKERPTMRSRLRPTYHRSCRIGQRKCETATSPLVPTTSTNNVAANTDTTWTTGCRQSAKCKRVPPPRDFSEGHMRTIDDELNRLRAEFLEMPGLYL